ncbi:lipid-transfer protein [soil metagenome]
MSALGACIVGIGETDYHRFGGITDRDEFQLAVQAIKAAATDAGLSVDDLDGFACFSDTELDASLLALALGIPDLKVSASVWGGRGGGSCGALALAASAVESGQARHVAVFRSLCQGRSRRYGKFYPQRMHADMVGPYGLFSAAQGLALVVQRYRHEVGFDEGDMAAIVLSARDNAQRNPRAVLHGRPLTLQRYLESRWIAEPFRAADCCLETDGACAVIVSSRERARDLARPPVDILAAVQGSDPEWATGAMGAHNMPRDRYASSGQRELARRLYGRAQVDPRDIDVAQLYDHFSGMLFMVLEDFGLCDRGEAPAFVRAGNIASGGRVPINTSGGALAEAYVHGMNHIVEAARQLRAESTSQVSGAELCLVTGGSVISPSSAAILARSQSLS